MKREADDSPPRLVNERSAARRGASEALRAEAGDAAETGVVRAAGETSHTRVCIAGAAVELLKCHLGEMSDLLWGS